MISNRTTRRGLPGALAALAMTFAMALPAAAGQPAGKFIETLGQTAIRDLAQKGITQAERESRFRTILTANFDMPRISRFVLGRYARRAEPDDLKAFAGAYEDFMVLTYARLFASYAGESFRVTRDLSTPDSKYAVVKTEIELPGNGETIAIDWQVKTGDRNAVVDLRVEGVSMAVTQRDEFATVLKKNDGNVAVLVDELRRRIDRLKAEPAS